MKNLSGQQSLWVVFPVLLFLFVLIAGIIFLPTAQTELRSRASEPKPIPISRTESPEVICSELYSPVCGSNGTTYNNGCEANLAGITSYTLGSCLTPKATLTPTTTTPKPHNLLYTLPTTN